MVERQKDSSLQRFLFFYATIIEGVSLIEYLPGDARRYTIDLSVSRKGRRIISITD